MKISAWLDFARAESPDERYDAIYDDAMEIAMGAPTMGTITVNEKTSGNCVIQISGCNGSFVWSSDSSALAFPRWTRKKMQQLVILRFPSCITEPIAGEYRVLELESFADGVISGIDSPVYQPSVVRVETSKEPIQPPQPTAVNRRG